MNVQQCRPELRVEQIQYFPEQRCPLCAAPASTDKRGNWYVSYTDFFGSALRNWETYIGYVFFTCHCDHKPGPGMRVARVGDALIPLHFSDRERARSVGLDHDVMNAHEVAQAVDFLVKNADPMCTAQHDELRCMLFEVASGKVGPDQAHHRIQSWVFDAAAQGQET
ncbi:MAG: hypothetical protein JNM55_20980 [Anaerolineales bacterium]|nr:hypothetical protein [Anaerolineales bacterium]